MQDKAGTDPTKTPSGPNLCQINAKRAGSHYACGGTVNAMQLPLSVVYIPTSETEY